MAANEDSFRYTMLRCSLTQAAVASWIVSLRHWAINICIDFNEVSYVICVIAAYRHANDLLFKKPGFISVKTMLMRVKHKKPSVSVLFILVCLVPLSHIVYLTLASRRRLTR